MKRKFPFELGIIDFNGTLQNDLRVTLKAARETFTRLTGTCPILTEDSFKREITLRAGDFFKKYGVSEDRRTEGDAIRKECFRRYPNDQLLSPGAKEALVELFPHIKLAIASGEIHGFVRERLEHLGVSDFFEIIKDGVHDKKSAFKEILHAYSIGATKTFCLDDGPEGIVAANALGMFSIAFVHNGSYCFEERIFSAKPDIVIRSLSELIPALENFTPR